MNKKKRESKVNLPRSQCKLIAGFSLVEVLISIVVLSFGLLGMVGLQAAALQGNRDARYQSTAVSLAREIAEMMRGNKDIAMSPDNPYLGDFKGASLAPTTKSECLNAGNTCAAESDGPTAVANAEMTDWLKRVGQLPGARAKICFDDAPFDASGLPQWACNKGVNATIMIKLGWTRGSTNRSQSNLTPLEFSTGASSRPVLVVPVTPGNTL